MQAAKFGSLTRCARHVKRVRGTANRRAGRPSRIDRMQPWGPNCTRAARHHGETVFETRTVRRTNVAAPRRRLGLRTGRPAASAGSSKLARRRGVKVPWRNVP